MGCLIETNSAEGYTQLIYKVTKSHKKSHESSIEIDLPVFFVHHQLYRAAAREESQTFNRLRKTR
jgi:hypothetical protein